MPEGDYTIPLGVADVKRPGSDVTVVALAWLVHEALAAAEELAREGISVEVVDPRTLVPLDTETIRDSVRKTGRLVIADEAGPTAGFSAEVAAVVTEDAATFARLKAPVKRVCALQVPIPVQPGAGECGVSGSGIGSSPGSVRCCREAGRPRHSHHARGATMPAAIVIADSITRVGPEAAGAVVVNASHGGVYAAYLAAKLHAAAAIFNDAGVGRDRAGIGGLDYLEDFGIAAATVGHDTARIGDGADRCRVTQTARPPGSSPRADLPRPARPKARPASSTHIYHRSDCDRPALHPSSGPQSRTPESLPWLYSSRLAPRSVSRLVSATSINRMISSGRGCEVGYPRQGRLTRTMSGCGSVPYPARSDLYPHPGPPGNCGDQQLIQRIDGERVPRPDR